MSDHRLNYYRLNVEEGLGTMDWTNVNLRSFYFRIMTLHRQAKVEKICT